MNEFLIHSYALPKGLEEVERYILGHEYGTTDKKCHLQCYVMFKKKINKSIKTFKVQYNTETYGWLIEACHQRDILVNYCLKDGDFVKVGFEPKNQNIFEMHAELTTNIMRW